MLSAAIAANFDTDTFKRQLGRILGTATGNIEVVSVADGKVTWRFTGPDASALAEASESRIGPADYAALGITSRPAPVDNVPGTEASSPWWIAGVVVGCLALIGAVVLVFRLRAKPTSRFDDDYIAMQDYRPPEV